MKLLSHGYFGKFILKYYRKLVGDPDASFPINKYWGFSDHMSILIGMNRGFLIALGKSSVSKKPSISKFVTHPDSSSFYSVDCEIEMLDTLFFTIIPILVNLIPLLVSGEKNNIYLGLGSFLQVLHILKCTNYEKAAFSVLNDLKFFENSFPLIFLFICNNLALFNSLIVEYIHADVENLIKRNVTKNEKEVNMLLKNLGAIGSCRVLIEEFLGFKSKHTYHMKYKCPEKYVKIAEKVIITQYALANKAKTRFLREMKSSNSLSSHSEVVKGYGNFSFNLKLKFLESNVDEDEEENDIVNDEESEKVIQISCNASILSKFREITFCDEYFLRKNGRKVQGRMSNHYNISDKDLKIVKTLIESLGEVDCPRNALENVKIPRIFFKKVDYGKKRDQTYDPKVRYEIVKSLEKWDFLHKGKILYKKDAKILMRSIDWMDQNDWDEERKLKYIKNVKKDELKKIYKNLDK